MYQKVLACTRARAWLELVLCTSCCAIENCHVKNGSSLIVMNTGNRQLKIKFGKSLYKFTDTISERNEPYVIVVALLTKPFWYMLYTIYFDDS